MQCEGPRPLRVRFEVCNSVTYPRQCFHRFLEVAAFGTAILCKEFVYYSDTDVVPPAAFTSEAAGHNGLGRPCRWLVSCPEYAV